MMPLRATAVAAAAVLLGALPTVQAARLASAPSDTTDATSASAAGANGVGTAPANVVLLFLDDHGWGDVGANVGAAAVPETPHMDALAASGARFTDFHAGYSVCTASRAAVLTGRLAPRTGVFGNFGPTSSEGLALQERTIADVLGGAGYDTHMIGKWHCGHGFGFSPTFRGFQTWFGLPYSGDMGCIDATPQGCKPSYDRTQGQPACPALCPADAANTTAAIAIPLYDSTARNCSGHASCNEDIAEQPFDPMSLNHQYAARANQLISSYSRPSNSSSSAGPNPFLLYVAFAHTHTPLAYDPKWENASSRPGFRKVFGNTLAEVDDAIGQIVRALDNHGLANNTLVLLAADNGPSDLGSVDCDDVGDPGPYRGAWQRSPSGGGGGATSKGTVWEGGHRVVGMARMPGRIPAGRVIAGVPAMTVDWLPTAAALAGAALPSDRRFDGVDLAPLLFAPDAEALAAAEARLANRTLFHPLGNARSRPGTHASHADHVSDVPAFRRGRYKAFYATASATGCRLPDGKPRDGTAQHALHDPPMVFDVVADPAESTPLSEAQLPAGVLDDLRDAYTAFWTDVESSLRSTTNYTSNPADRPCSNQASSCCRKDNHSTATTKLL